MPRGRPKGYKCPPEVAEKNRRTFLGRKHTPEARAKMSAARKGKPLSAAHRAALSAAHKGKEHSPETRARIAAALKAASLARFEDADYRREPESERVVRDPWAALIFGGA